ncbi:MAG: VOC family protein [Polyangiales bacterium]
MSAFVHMELSTSDVSKAKKFYKSVLGWKYQEMPMPGGSYTLVMSDSGPVGGMQKNPMPKAPNSWCGYASVKSVARTVAKVKKLGGKVIVPKTDLPSGSLAVLTDPQGATFGIWQAAPAKPTTKKAAKKTTKKAAKKTTKKAAKKTTKKAAKKRATKKAAKKTTKKAAKKTIKKAAKKTTKKTAKKRAAKKK